MLARLQVADGVVADTKAYCGDRNCNSDGDERLEAPMSVGMVAIGRRIPEVAPDDYRNVGQEVRCAVNGVGDKSLGVPDCAHDEFRHREDGIPKEADPGYPADTAAIVFFAHASHCRII